MLWTSSDNHIGQCEGKFGEIEAELGKFLHPNFLAAFSGHCLIVLQYSTVAKGQRISTQIRFPLALHQALFHAMHQSRYLKGPIVNRCKKTTKLLSLKRQHAIINKGHLKQERGNHLARGHECTTAVLVLVHYWAITT